MRETGCPECGAPSKHIVREESFGSSVTVMCVKCGWSPKVEDTPVAVEPQPEEGR